MDKLTVPEDIRQLIDGLAPKAATLPEDVEGICAPCGGTGWRSVSRGVQRCDCSAPVTADGVPYEFYDARLSNYRREDGNRTAVAKAQAFLDGTRDLYLAGDVGAGKTRLACSILNEHASRRQTALFVNVPRLLHQLQPGHDADGIEQKLMTASLVVLDDIGAERDQPTDYTRRTLYMVYETRHANRLRTIFTSNKTIQQLSDMQDDTRLASRITGWADVVKLTTPDQRLLRRVK